MEDSEKNLPVKITGKPISQIPEKLKRHILNKYIQPLQAKGYSYGGASEDKVAFKGFEGVSGSAADDIHENLAQLRNRCRMLEMLSPEAKAIISTYTTNVIGRGLKLQSKVDADVLGLSADEALELETQIEREFALWAEDRFNCDNDAMDDFYGLQQSVFANFLRSGDCLVLVKPHRISKMRPYALRLQMVEADRCRTPQTIPGWSTTAIVGTHKIFDGVEVDQNGEVVAYHFSKHHPMEFNTDWNDANEWIKVRAKGYRTDMPNVLHVMRRTRPEQYRGIPILSEVVEPLLQINRYANAETMAAILQNYVAAWIIRKAEDSGDDEIAQLGEDAIRQTLDEISWSPASMIYLDEGQEPRFNEPTHPSSNYPQFIEANMLRVGASVGMPYEILSKRHDASYSASRAAHLDFSKEVELLRDSFVRDFCQPVFEWFLSESVIQGRIKAPGFFDDPIIRKAYLKAYWVGPSMGSLNPKDEIEALVNAMQNNLVSGEYVAQTLFGHDYYDMIEARKNELELVSQLPADPNSVYTYQYAGKGGDGDGKQILDDQGSENRESENRDLRNDPESEDDSTEPSNVS